MKPIRPGMKFNRFTVLSEAEPYISPSGKTYSAKFNVVCDCGNLRSVRGMYLHLGRSKSCGCYRIERSKEHRRIHGDAPKGAPTKEYTCWGTMIARCENPKSTKYAIYGARGISICTRWRHGEDGKTGYECFLEDMGRKLSPKHSIERNDNDGPYAPWNCRWATAKEQRANQRPYVPFKPKSLQDKGTIS